MVLLGDVDQVEACFGPFEDSVTVDARLVHSLRQTCNKLRNHFGHTRWNSYVTLVKWKLIWVCLDHLGTRKEHGLCRMYHMHENIFGRT
jgi:hypothetical protein